MCKNKEKYFRALFDHFIIGIKLHIPYECIISAHAYWWYKYIDGLVEDVCNSIANALELLQLCTEPSTYPVANNDRWVAAIECS